MPSPPMKELDNHNSRRQFLRAAFGLGALALGAEAALGAGLRPVRPLGPSAQSECYTLTCTETLRAVAFRVGAETRTVTRSGTHTRTSGTLTKSKAIAGTQTTLETLPGPPPSTVTRLASMVATPPVTYVYTFSYGPGGHTVTESIPIPYTMNLSQTLTKMWWVHGQDCNGEHGEGGDDTDILARPPREARAAGAVDVLDASSRWERLTLPELD